MLLKQVWTKMLNLFSSSSTSSTGSDSCDEPSESKQRLDALINDTTTAELVRIAETTTSARNTDQERRLAELEDRLKHYQST